MNSRYNLEFILSISSSFDGCAVCLQMHSALCIDANNICFNVSNIFLCILIQLQGHSWLFLVTRGHSCVLLNTIESRC